MDKLSRLQIDTLSREKIEALADLLASIPNMNTALSQGLRYILDETQRSSGALFLQEAVEEAPFLVLGENLPQDWEDLLNLPESPLRQICRNSTLESGSRLSVNTSTEGIVYPLIVPYGLQGYLLLTGVKAGSEEHEFLLSAARVLSRTVFIGRHQTPLPEMGKALATLETIFSSLISDLPAEEIQTKTVTGIRDSFLCEAGCMALADGENEGLLIKKTLVSGSDWIYQASVKTDQGLIGICLQESRPVLVNDPQNDPNFKPEIDGMAELPVRSILCVPLKVDAKAIGVLQLLNKRSGAFTEYDQSLLTALANSIAGFLHYQKTVQQLRVLNAHLEASRWELVRSRNTLRSLFDNLPESLYIIDRKYHLIAVNMARSKRAQQEPSQLVGKLCYEALYHRNEPCAGCMVGETFYNRKLTHRVERQWIENSDPLEWEISTYPITDEFDQVTQVILFEQDVTDKNRLEAILAQSEKMAAVGQLAAGIAHEINNPLTVILANAQLLQRDLPVDSEMQESIDLIYRAGSRALYVVRNLLDFARKEKYEFVPTDINGTIQRSLEMLKHELLERSINLIFEPGEGLPLVMASADHLQGVWLNVILNAMDAIEREDGFIKVNTGLHSNELRIIISDNGDGIPPENLKHIFEPFYTTKEPGRGTGLGLSVCHRIVKQHGGHIQVDSKIGQGTTFTVVLPVY